MLQANIECVIRNGHAMTDEDLMKYFLLLVISSFWSSWCGLDGDSCMLLLTTLNIFPQKQKAVLWAL